MSIYLSSNPGSYTQEAANLECQIKEALRPLLIKTVEDYHMSVEDFFMLVSRAADMDIMSYNRQQMKRSEKHLDHEPQNDASEDDGCTVWRLTMEDGAISDVVYATDSNHQVISLDVLHSIILDDTVMNAELVQTILSNKNRIVTVKSGLTKKEAIELINKIKKETSNEG